jgi:uncharacterized phage-associated protein
MSRYETPQKKSKKFSEMVNYICHKYNQGDLTELKLWKLLFFCEADFYERYDKRLTDIDFIKNTHGPTPEYPLAKKIIERLLEKQCIIKQNESQKYPRFECSKEPALEALTAQELESIQETCKKYFRLSASDLRTLSHQDPIYLGAEKEKDILDFSFVKYRITEESEESHDEKRNVIQLSNKASSKLASLFA